MQDETVDLWALDEVHFQQQGSRCRMWVPPEIKDPVVYHHPTRKSVGYFAAVRLETVRLETASCCFVASPEDSMATASGSSSNCSERPARSPAAACWPSATTRNTIDPNCTWIGASGNSPIRLGLLAALQSRTEPDRKGLEAHPSIVPPQPLLWLSR